MRKLSWRIPRLAANFAALSAAEFVSKILVALAFAYLARVLGPEIYGHLEFTLAIIFLFSLVVDTGLGTYGAREIAKDAVDIKFITRHILLTRTLLALTAYGLLVVAVLVIDKPWAVKQLLLLYGLTLLGLPGVMQWVFQGRDLMHYVALASVARWFVFVAGVFLLVRADSPFWMLALVEGLAVTAFVGYYTVVFVRHFGWPWGAIDARYMLSVFRQSLPIGASELVWAIKIYFATVLLGLMIAGPEVGWFGAAHRLVIALHTFVFLYFFNLLPSIARTSQGRVEELRRLLGTSLQLTAWLAVFIGITGTVFAKPAIALLYGAEYQQTAIVFQVLIWLIPLTLMSNHFQFTLIGYNRQQLQFWVAALGAVINITLSLILIPRYGLQGAAWAIIISEIIIWGVAWYLIRRHVAYIPVWRYIYRPLAAGAILVGVVMILPAVNIWLMGVTTVAVYGLALVVIQPRLLFDVRAMLIPDGPSAGN